MTEGERSASGHLVAARSMLDVVAEAYEHARRADADPTAAWAATCVDFSNAIGVSDDDRPSWLLVGVVVAAVARMAEGGVRE